MSRIPPASSGILGVRITGVSPLCWFPTSFCWQNQTSLRKGWPQLNFDCSRPTKGVPFPLPVIGIWVGKGDSRKCGQCPRRPLGSHQKGFLVSKKETRKGCSPLSLWEMPCLKVLPELLQWPQVCKWKAVAIKMSELRRDANNLTTYWKTKLTWVNFKDLIGFIQWFMNRAASRPTNRKELQRAIGSERPL